MVPLEEVKLLPLNKPPYKTVLFKTTSAESSHVMALAIPIQNINDYIMKEREKLKLK